MPVYEIEHACALSPTQQQSIAAAITKIHAKTFTTPSFFVNVRFKHTGATPLYVGGKKREINLILAHVRHGPSRTIEMWDQLCSEVRSAWKSIVGDTPELELRTMFILGSMIGGIEAGFPVPPAGEDKAWLKHNLSEFRRLADNGDPDFQGFVQELQTRDDLKEVLAH